MKFKSAVPVLATADIRSLSIIILRCSASRSFSFSVNLLSVPEWSGMASCFISPTTWSWLMPRRVPACIQMFSYGSRMWTASWTSTNSAERNSSRPLPIERGMRESMWSKTRMNIVSKSRNRSMGSDTPWSGLRIRGRFKASVLGQRRSLFCYIFPARHE